MRSCREAFILCSILSLLQNKLHGSSLKYSIFLINLCDQPILIYFNIWDLSQMCEKQRPFYPPVFLDFSIAHDAI